MRVYAYIVVYTFLRLCEYLTPLLSYHPFMPVRIPLIIRTIPRSQLPLNLISIPLFIIVAYLLLGWC